jgi:hypothetical protein
VPAQKRPLETSSGDERPAKIGGTFLSQAAPSPSLTPSYGSSPMNGAICPNNDHSYMQFDMYGEPYSFETFPNLYEDSTASPLQDEAWNFFGLPEEPSESITQSAPYHQPEITAQPHVVPFSYQSYQSVEQPSLQYTSDSYANLTPIASDTDIHDVQGGFNLNSGESAQGPQTFGNTSANNNNSSPSAQDYQDSYLQVNSSVTSLGPNTVYNQDHAYEHTASTIYPSYSGQYDSSDQQPVFQYPFSNQTIEATNNSFYRSQPVYPITPVNPIPVQPMHVSNQNVVYTPQTSQGNALHYPMSNQPAPFNNRPYSIYSQSQSNQSFATSSLNYDQSGVPISQHTILPVEVTKSSSQSLAFDYTQPSHIARQVNPNLQASHLLTTQQVFTNYPANLSYQHRIINFNPPGTYQINNSGIQPANTSTSHASQVINQTQTRFVESDGTLVGRPLLQLPFDAGCIKTWLDDVPQKRLSYCDFLRKCIDPEKLANKKKAHIVAWRDALTTLFPMDTTLNSSIMVFSVKYTAFRLGEYLKKYVELGPDPIRHPILSYYKVDLKFLQKGISYLEGIQFYDRLEIKALYKFVNIVSGADSNTSSKLATNFALKSIINWIVVISAHFGNDCVSFFKYDPVSDMCTIHPNIKFITERSSNLTILPAISAASKKKDVTFIDYMEKIYYTARLLFPEKDATGQEVEYEIAVGRATLTPAKRQGMMSKIFTNFKIYLRKGAKEPIINADYLVDVGRLTVAVNNFDYSRVRGNYGAHIQRFCVDMNSDHSPIDKAEVAVCFFNWIISVAAYYGNPNASKFTYNPETKCYYLKN